MTLNNLLRQYKTYGVESGPDLITRACNFAEAAHVGEVGRFGKGAFIDHPLAVATLLVDIQSDAQTLSSALLHDVLEHTDIKKDDLASEFNEEIADLVDGVTVIQHVSKKVGDPSTALRTRKRTEENLQKLLLASARDPRVLLIRMAEEVDNLRNLEHFSKEEQKDMLEKAFEIYSPLANFLGVRVFKNQLEDLAFKQVNPEEFARITRKVKALAKKQAGQINALQKRLVHELEESGICAEVDGRRKHIYGIYRKLPHYEKEGRGVWYDVLGLRVIVERTGDCYRVLDVVRSLGRPEHDLFDDYIAKPKINGYQSLHTMIWLDKSPVEVQIRTKEMHKIAEFGLAAHAHYKLKDRSLITPEDKIELLRQLIGWEKEKKLNLFADKVFVFTPKADVIDLPAGATPVDFAFAVHTDLGRTCNGAVVNGKMVSLDYNLRNGDAVEIKTARGRKPSVDWLKFVKTDLATREIKKALKRG
jgi:guanosine-3',5'-bis(diphosphate) 3'-pyrophosphohydrolase